MIRVKFGIPEVTVERPRIEENSRVFLLVLKFSRILCKKMSRKQKSNNPGRRLLFRKNFEKTILINCCAGALILDFDDYQFR